MPLQNEHKPEEENISCGYTLPHEKIFLRIPLPHEKAFLADSLPCLYALQAGERPQKCFLPAVHAQGVYSYAGGRTSDKNDFLHAVAAMWYVYAGERPQEMFFPSDMVIDTFYLSIYHSFVTTKDLRRRI